MSHVWKGAMRIEVPNLPPRRCGGTELDWVFANGGRHTTIGDGQCFHRAAAIITGIDRMAIDEAIGPGSVEHDRADRFMRSIGYRFTRIRSHSHTADMPMGRLLVGYREHATALIDRVVHDTWNVTADVFRTHDRVTGFWSKR